MEPHDQPSTPPPLPSIPSQNFVPTTETFAVFPSSSTSSFTSSSSLTASVFSSFLSRCSKFLIWLSQKEKEILGFQQNMDTDLLELRKSFFKLEKTIGIVNRKKDELMDILKEGQHLKNDENLNGEIKLEIKNKVENTRSAWQNIFIVSGIEQKRLQKLINNSQLEYIKELESKLNVLEANMDGCCGSRHHLPPGDKDLLQEILTNINVFKKEFHETKKIVEELKTIIIFPEENSGENVNENRLKKLKDRWNKIYEWMEKLKNKEESIKEFKTLERSMNDWIDDINCILDEKLCTMTGRNMNSFNKSKSDTKEKLCSQNSSQILNETSKIVQNKHYSFENEMDTWSESFDSEMELAKSLKTTESMMGRQKENFNSLKRLAQSILYSEVQQNNTRSVESTKIVKNLNFSESGNDQLFLNLNQHLSSIINRWEIIHKKFNFLSEKLKNEKVVVVDEVSIEHGDKSINFNDKTEKDDEKYKKPYIDPSKGFYCDELKSKELFPETRKENTCDNINWIERRKNCGGNHERFLNRNRSISDNYDLRLNNKTEEIRFKETKNKIDIENLINNFVNIKSRREPNDECLEKEDLKENVSSLKESMIENLKQSHESPNKNDKAERKCSSAKVRSSSYHLEANRKTSFNYKKFFWKVKKNKKNSKKTINTKNHIHQRENSSESKTDFEEKNLFLCYDLPLLTLNEPANAMKKIVNRYLHDTELNSKNENLNSKNSSMQQKVKTLTRSVLEDVNTSKKEFSDVFVNKSKIENLKKNTKAKNMRQKEKKIEELSASKESKILSQLTPDQEIWKQNIAISSKCSQLKNKVKNRSRKRKVSKKHDFKANSCSRLDAGDDDRNTKMETFSKLNEGSRSLSTASMNAQNIDKMHLDLLKWLHQTEMSQVMISSSLSPFVTDLSSEQENLSFNEIFELFQEIEEEFNQQVKTLTVFKKAVTNKTFPIFSSYHSICSLPTKHRGISESQKSTSSWLTIVKEIEERFEAVRYRQISIRKNIEIGKLEQKINQNIEMIEINIEKQEQWLEMNLWQKQPKRDFELLQRLLEQYKVKARLLKRQQPLIEKTKVFLFGLKESKCAKEKDLEFKIETVENLWITFSEKMASAIKELELFLSGDFDISTSPVNLDSFLDLINDKMNNLNENQNEEANDENIMIMEGLRGELKERFSLFEDLLNSDSYNDHELAKKWIETSSLLDKKLSEWRKHDDSKYQGCLSRLRKWMDGFETKLEMKEHFFYNMSILQQKIYQLENFHRHNGSFERLYKELLQSSQEFMNNSTNENLKKQIEQDVTKVLKRWSYIQDKTIKTREDLMQIHQLFEEVVKELEKVENSLIETEKIDVTDDKMSKEKVSQSLKLIQESKEKLTKMKEKDMVVIKLKTDKIFNNYSHILKYEDGEIAVTKQHKLLNEALDKALGRLESKEKELTETYNFQNSEERKLQELESLVDKGLEDISSFTLQQLLNLKDKLSFETSLTLEEANIDDNDVKLMLKDQDLRVDIEVNENLKSKKREEKNDNIEEIFSTHHDSNQMKSSESRITFEIKKSLIKEKVNKLQNEISNRISLTSHHENLATPISSWISKATNYLNDEIVPLNELPSLLSTFSLKNVLTDYKAFLAHQLRSDEVKNFNGELEKMCSQLDELNEKEPEGNPHLMTSMENIKKKFRTFLKPPDYDEKLEIVQNEIKQLGNILGIKHFDEKVNKINENNLKTGSEMNELGMENEKKVNVYEENYRERLVVSNLHVEEVENKFMQVKHIYAKLSALKRDLETLLRLGRIMVEEGVPFKIIADPTTFTQTLNQLKMFFNILGNKVSRTKLNFEKLIENREKITDTMNIIEKRIGDLSQVVSDPPDSNTDSYSKILEEDLYELEKLLDLNEKKLKEHSEIVETNFIEKFYEKGKFLKREIECLKKNFKEKKFLDDNSYIENIWNIKKSKEVLEADQSTVLPLSHAKKSMHYETSKMPEEEDTNLLEDENLTISHNEKERYNSETEEKISKNEPKHAIKEINTCSQTTENSNCSNNQKTSSLKGKKEPELDNITMKTLTNKYFRKEYDKLIRRTPSIARFIFCDETEFDNVEENDDYYQKDESIFDSGDDGNVSDDEEEEEGSFMTKARQLKYLQKYLKLFSEFKDKVESSESNDEFRNLLNQNFHCLKYYSEVLQDFRSKRRNFYMKTLNVENRLKMAENSEGDEDVDLKKVSKIFRSMKKLEKKNFVQLEEEITKNLHNYFEKNKLKLNENIRKLIVEKVKVFQSDSFEILNNKISARKERLQKSIERLFTLHIPHSTLRLNKTVASPWQRSQTSQYQVPYYINHHTQDTQWMHPHLTLFFKKIEDLSNVRYSAYRVALKLQKLSEIVLFDKIPIEKVMKTITNFEYKSENKIVENIMKKYKIGRDFEENNKEKLTSDTTNANLLPRNNDELTSSLDNTSYSIEECYHLLGECFLIDDANQDGIIDVKSNSDNESNESFDDDCNQQFIDENLNKKKTQKKNYNQTFGKRQNKPKNLNYTKNEGLMSSKISNMKKDVDIIKRDPKDAHKTNDIDSNKLPQQSLAIETIMSCLVKCFDKEKKGRLGKTEVHVFLVTMAHTASIYLKYQCLLGFISREETIDNLPKTFKTQSEDYDYLIEEPNPLITTRSLNRKRKSSSIDNRDESFVTKSNFRASITTTLAPLFPSALAFKQKHCKENKNNQLITTKDSNKQEKLDVKKRSSSLPPKMKSKTVLKKDLTKVSVAEKAQLRRLLICLLQLPHLLGEAASFPEGDVDQIFEQFFSKYAPNDLVATEDVLTWLKKGDCLPLAWFSCYYRMSMAMSVVHEGVCSVCGVTPYYGLKYRCLRCFNFNCCQNCFLYNRNIDETKNKNEQKNIKNKNKQENIINDETINKSNSGRSNGTLRSKHKISHPMQEYWTETSVFDAMKDFPIIIRNRLRSRESLRNHNISSYLPKPKQDDKTWVECQNVTTENAQYHDKKVDDKKENKTSKKQKIPTNEKINTNNDKVKTRKRNFLKRLFKSSSLNNLQEIANEKFENQKSVVNNDTEVEKFIKNQNEQKNLPDDIRKYHTVARSKFDHEESSTHRNDQYQEENTTKEIKIEAGENESIDEHHLIAEYSRLMRKQYKSSSNKMRPPQLTHKQQLEAAIRALNKENKFLLKEMKRRKKFEAENSENEFKRHSSDKQTQNSIGTLHNKSSIQKLELSNV